MRFTVRSKRERFGNNRRMNSSFRCRGVGATAALGLSLLCPVTRPADSEGAASPSNAATVQELPQVIVIGNAPLPGFGLPLNQIPSNVQSATSADMERQQTSDVADYINNNFSGVNVSESADNPFQLDIYYHGFTASPLLGTPEGLSVYVDGVRVNEAFGDTVNWDLIPESAISTVSLIEGSNPIFGLNTLGGALSVQTKSGHDDPGTQLEAYGGSFGRRVLQAQTGGALGAFDYFATGSYFDETGWRDLSPTRVWQGFGKVGWQTDRTDVDLSYTFADTDLFGNGATPLSMLYYRREQSYTPDSTGDLLHFVNLTGTQFLTDSLLLSGNAFYRHLNTASSNGSNNDNYLSAGPYDCSLPPPDGATLAYCANSVSEVSRLRQSGLGLGAQLTDSQDLFGWKNQAILGLDYTDSTDRFAQQFQYGNFAPNHLLIYENSPFNDQTVISLDGGNRILGVYVTDTLSPGEQLHVTVSARYNRNDETLNGYSVDTDISDAGSGFGSASALTGDHTFARTNPAIGFTYTPTTRQTWYVNYNQASRAPTVIELGCANPAQPCGLPNDFASDPGLRQVVAHTLELGLRGNLTDSVIHWSADLFRTINSDDLQFIATSTNAGYFSNVGSTRRQGLDLSLGGTREGFRWRVNYSLVDATFQSSFPVSAQSNSTADANGEILVRPGDRLPLTPRNTGRVILGYDYGRLWELGATLIISSGAYLHGNENNANVGGATNAAGAYILPGATGSIPGYAVLNLQGTYHAGRHLDVFARLVNALNRQYATAGFLTTNTFNPNGTFRPDPATWTNENAVSPGAPRALWGGVRVSF